MAGMPTCIRSRCPAMALRKLMMPPRSLTHALQGSMVARACIAFIVLLVSSVAFPVRFIGRQGCRGDSTRGRRLGGSREASRHIC